MVHKTSVPRVGYKATYSPKALATASRPIDGRSVHLRLVRLCEELKSERFSIHNFEVQVFKGEQGGSNQYGFSVDFTFNASDSEQEELFDHLYAIISKIAEYYLADIEVASDPELRTVTTCHDFLPRSQRRS